MKYIIIISVMISSLAIAKEEVDCKQHYKNRVRLLGGSSPDNYKSQKLDNSSIKLSSERKAVYGLGYDRMVSDKVSIGGQVLSNETYLMSVGLDF